MPQLAKKLADDHDFLIEKKTETLTEINTLYNLINDRIKVCEKKVPIKPYIIGKTQTKALVDEISTEFY